MKWRWRSRLKEYRTQLGINQADMKPAGVSRQTINLIERGLFTFSDTGFEAGEDLSGDSGRYFTYTEDGEDE